MKKVTDPKFNEIQEKKHLAPSKQLELYPIRDVCFSGRRNEEIAEKHCENHEYFNLKD